MEREETAVPQPNFADKTIWTGERTGFPRRTDIDAPINYRQNKHTLFGQQEGPCNGCKGDFPFKLFEVDHVIP